MISSTDVDFDSLCLPVYKQIGTGSKGCSFILKCGSCRARAQRLTLRFAAAEEPLTQTPNRRQRPGCRAASPRAALLNQSSEADSVLREIRFYRLDVRRTVGTGDRRRLVLLRAANKRRRFSASV